MKAPFTWPKSSLSKRLSETAPMSTEMKTSPARAERRWISRATSSLPEPFSPRMRTLASVADTLAMVSKISRMGGESPMMSTKGWSRSAANWSWRERRPRASDRELRSCAAADRVASSFSFCHGLRTKSTAPSRTARTAISTSPYAVMGMTTDSGSSSWICCSQ